VNNFRVKLALHKVIWTLQRPAVKYMRLCCRQTRTHTRSHEGLLGLCASYYSAFSLALRRNVLTASSG